jgi:pyruvate carboxylase
VPDHLFVYGSLRSQCGNLFARLLREKAESLGHAAVRGSVFRVGPYPGYRREPDGIVHGELWRLADPEPTLAALDEYEGPDYSRVIAGLETPPMSAWIYLYNGGVRMEQRILSGDFLAP